MRRFPLIPALLVLLAALALVACGGADASFEGGVTIEPLSPTPKTSGFVPKQAPSSDVAAQQVQPTAAPSTPEARPTPAPAEASPEPDSDSLEPQSGRWIEVDVTNYMVRLMDGERVVQQIGPVGVGEQIDTGDYLSTQTGLFHVYNKSQPLVYDPPFDTYISDWVGFDPDKDNGFHSFLKDADGNVVDASTGRVSNGCIRTGGADAIFAFAEIGMPVWVHW